MSPSANKNFPSLKEVPGEVVLKSKTNVSYT